VARFLSAAWFDEIESARPGDSGEAAKAYDGTDPEDRLVLKQVVTGTPDGEVSYLVVVDGEQARVERPPGSPGDGDIQLTITCDWPTATAIAQGLLSTQRALMQGRLRVRGSPTALLARGRRLANIDPVPAEVRQNTTY
jgi:SCP-2 sterol transfer family